MSFQFVSSLASDHKKLNAFFSNKQKKKPHLELEPQWRGEKVLNSLGYFDLLSLAVGYRGVEVEVAGPQAAVDGDEDQEDADPATEASPPLFLEPVLFGKGVETQGRRYNHEAEPGALVAEVVQCWVAEVRAPEGYPYRALLSTHVTHQPCTLKKIIIIK